jgi:hypothetical protein
MAITWTLTVRQRLGKDFPLTRSYQTSNRRMSGR